MELRPRELKIGWVPVSATFCTATSKSGPLPNPGLPITTDKSDMAILHLGWWLRCTAWWTAWWGDEVKGYIIQPEWPITTTCEPEPRSIITWHRSLFPKQVVLGMATSHLTKILRYVCWNMCPLSCLWFADAELPTPSTWQTANRLSTYRWPVRASN